MFALARLLMPVLLLVACASPADRPPPAISQPRADVVPTPAGQRDLEVLVSFFTGNWHSKPGEPPMVLRVAEFWKGSPVRWLYLEWVRPGAESRPSRQLVLRVAEDGSGRMTTTVHRLPGNGARHVGEWRKAQPFAGMRPADLVAIEACRMRTIRTMIAHFTMTTDGLKCPGDLAGVPFMRFEFSITSAELDLLEQPRDAAGNVPPKSRLEPFTYRRLGTTPG